jgi:hypothetical protein
LTLKCDEALSNVAFNCNVRRYNEDLVFDIGMDGGCGHPGRAVQVQPS